MLEDSGQSVAVVLSVEEYRRLSLVETRERERLSQESYDQICGPFDRGEFHELTDQEWQALMDGNASLRTTLRALPYRQRARSGEAPSYPQRPLTPL